MKTFLLIALAVSLIEIFYQPRIDAKGRFIYLWYGTKYRRHLRFNKPKP